MNSFSVVEKEVARQKEFGMEPSWEDFVIAGMNEGAKQALRLYAWWKGGVQYVGTTGTTLEEALKEWE